MRTQNATPTFRPPNRHYAASSPELEKLRIMSEKTARMLSIRSGLRYQAQAFFNG